MSWNDSDLVRAWQCSSNAIEAAKKLNEPKVQAVKARASKLKKAGVPLKRFRRACTPITDLEALKRLCATYKAGAP